MTQPSRKLRWVLFLAKEANYFIKLPEWIKENILKQSPVYKEKVAA
jgi:hypothetical protein